MKKMIYGAAAALILATTGCTGSFQLMQAVHRWHRNFENRWTDEICYLVACILPIYAASYTVDTIFFNSVEFWMGTNPVQINTAEATITRVDATTAIVQSKATGETFTLKRAADGTFAMTDMHGNTVTAEMQGSLLTMTLPDGTTRTSLM
ncbi:MAG: DUF3332 family protein [Kiritimatiellae bacterium]|jgi:hypothetical protein|nr:DUF3332 family protein [Kiritimatiellia bacterium]